MIADRLIFYRSRLSYRSDDIDMFDREKKGRDTMDDEQAKKASNKHSRCDEEEGLIKANQRNDDVQLFCPVLHCY